MRPSFHASWENRASSTQSGRPAFSKTGICLKLTRLTASSGRPVFENAQAKRHPPVHDSDFGQANERVSAGVLQLRPVGKTPRLLGFRLRLRGLRIQERGFELGRGFAGMAKMRQ